MKNAKKCLTVATILTLLPLSMQAFAAFPKENDKTAMQTYTFKSKVVHLFVSEFYKTQEVDENYPYEPKTVRTHAVKDVKKIFNRKETKLVKRFVVK